MTCQGLVTPQGMRPGWVLGWESRRGPFLAQGWRSHLYPKRGEKVRSSLAYAPLTLPRHRTPWNALALTSCVYTLAILWGLLVCLPQEATAEALNILLGDMPRTRPSPGAAHVRVTSVPVPLAQGRAQRGPEGGCSTQERPRGRGAPACGTHPTP